MAGSKFLQIRYELGSFRRLMNFMEDENIYLKNRLSEVLKEEKESDLLEELELFQSRFIRYDVIISIARNDIAEFESVPEQGAAEKSEVKESHILKLKKMRAEFLILSTEFSNLKSGFNAFLLEKL
jgi:hypothetical protein